VKVLCSVKKGCKSKVFKSESDLQFLNHESISLAQWGKASVKQLATKAARAAVPLAGGFKKPHQCHPGTGAVSWCSCHDFNVCNTQPITNIYCNRVSYIPYNIAS
jgi:hypothetical protein